MTNPELRNHRSVRRALLAACSREGLTLTGLLEPLFPCAQSGDQAEGFAAVPTFPTLGRRAMSIVVDEDARLIIFGTVVMLRPVAGQTSWPTPRTVWRQRPALVELDDIQLVLHAPATLLATTAVNLRHVADPITTIIERLDRFVRTVDSVVVDLERLSQRYLVAHRPDRRWRRLHATDTSIVETESESRKGDDPTNA